MKVKKRWKLVALLFTLALFMFMNNSNLLIEERSGNPIFFAHVGLSQTYPMDGITGETCTAKRIYEPEHSFIGNTLPSMEAAFQEGADVVELDVHPTTDGEFAVFHDWTLECRTDGEGVTRDHSMAELKKLDVGYGYTADDGKTYPFRGKGVGMMPTLEEVLTAFPDHEFLINIKSNDPEEGVKLAHYLSRVYAEDKMVQLSVYGGDEPIARMQELMPDLRVMSKETLKACVLPYIAVGWTGVIPSDCENTQLHIPESIAPYLWGFPEKFLNRMDSAGTRVVLVAGNGGWSEGFDDREDMERIPQGYNGGIWTNRVDVVGE